MSFDYINQSQDDIFTNKEVVNLAEILGFDQNSMDKTDVRKRLHAVWDSYQEKGNNEGLIIYAKGILSQEGSKAGVHPLDVIYSKILSDNLLSEQSAPHITNAVLVVGGKIYEADNHYHAKEWARNDGQDVSKVEIERDGMFRVSDGRLLSRQQAKEEFNFQRSEQINNQHLY